MDKELILTVLNEQREEFLAKMNEKICERPEEALVDLDSNLAQVVIGIRRSGKSSMFLIS